MRKIIHILIAEDGRMSDPTLIRALQRSGYEVTTAHEGKEALKAVSLHKPDLIIADGELPEVDGYELCRQLKENPATRHIPVVLLTSLTDSTHVVRGLEVGADHFLVKPCPPDDLLPRIPRFLENPAHAAEPAAAVADSGAGRRRAITASRKRIVDLLEATHDVALERYREAVKTHDELRQLNTTLEQRVLKQTTAIAEAARQWRVTFDAMSDAVVLLDAKGRVQRCNQAFRTLTGKTFADVVGRSCCEVVHGAVGPIPGCPFVRMKASLQREALPFSINGCSFDAILDPVLDETGNLCGAVHTFVDITDLRRAEQDRIRLQAQLLQAQKLESIGTMASGVAHEVNTPLMGITCYAELIKEHSERRDPVIERFADDILQEIKRLGAIVSNLLQFVRHDTLTPTSERLCDIVEATLTLTRAVMRRDQIALETDVPPDLPAIRCRRQQIQQVLMNLLTNARDALNDKYPRRNSDKVMRISARRISGHVRLTVEDRGPGIPKELRERIFDPFFTTKPEGRGTGLGLAISHGIVSGHSGRLSVESEPGKWTRFHVDLPLDSESEAGR